MENCELKCKRIIGCHSCVIENIAEDMRLFRAAVVQFITEMDREKMRIEGHTLIKKIDEWYEPKTEA
jgi:hypothetical protein